MQLSRKGRLLLRELEGFETKRYVCPAGYSTIGVGHKLTLNELETGVIEIHNPRWTGMWAISSKLICPLEVEVLLDQDLVKFESEVDRLLSMAFMDIGNFNKLPSTQNQFDALVIFTFNVGINALMRSVISDLIKRWQLDDIPGIMRQWNKITDPKTGEMVVSQGLVNRRKKEIALFEGKS